MKKISFFQLMRGFVVCLLSPLIFLALLENSIYEDLVEDDESVEINKKPKGKTK